MTPLAHHITRFCGPAERSTWDVIDEFELEALDAISSALREAVNAGALVRGRDPTGFCYRSAFLGVDIDAVHRHQQELATT